MSLQELKSYIHQLVDKIDDEPALEQLLRDANRFASGRLESDIMDDLTDEQLAGIEKAREEARQGKGMPLTDFKRKMEEKWPQLKSL